MKRRAFFMVNSTIKLKVQNKTMLLVDLSSTIAYLKVNIASLIN